MILEATADDIEELYPLWQELMRLHHSHSPAFRCRPNQDTVLKAELKTRLRDKDTQVFVYERDEEWVGMVIASLRKSPAGFELASKGYIAETVIKPEYRNNGIGEALFEAARKWLQDRGADHIELQVSVKNTKAIKFWEKQGFSAYTQHMVLVLDRKD
jgi:ribosomal protein S18 acetylase RimI-like enzyme